MCVFSLNSHQSILIVPGDKNLVGSERTSWPNAVSTYLCKQVANEHELTIPTRYINDDDSDMFSRARCLLH